MAEASGMCEELNITANLHMQVCVCVCEATGNVAQRRRKHSFACLSFQRLILKELFIAPSVVAK